MDRQHKKRNILYLRGEPNSGKTFIAQSLAKSAFFYGAVTQGTSSYAFMWQDCINKRLILINEPYFDIGMVETLKTNLEGTGTFVHKKMSGDEYSDPHLSSSQLIVIFEVTVLDRKKAFLPDASISTMTLNHTRL
ncbi:unnamed protein product [Larinioides sclopetarius]|uniref:Parvovirus non-structural protein 1 helicase domain-containing protein n=1 Tax=Larinioides sclopetarius TaxID=280406 RepID=A0AAV1YUG9_9ARAC